MAKKNKRASIFKQYHAESPVGTEFRRLLHNVTRPVEGNERKSFLITSAMLSEGKSTISSHLAITAASFKKKRTVLIDCDLRRPVIHQMFDLPLEGGVTEIIEGSVKPEEAFKSTSIDSLMIVTAGAIRKNPTELFEGEKVKRVIEQVEFYFDLVLIDCAPIIPVSDPLVLAPDVDALLLVVKAGSTQKEVVKRACELAEKSSARIAGIVLNNMNGVLPYYYNHSYYGYNYSIKKS